MSCNLNCTGQNNITKTDRIVKYYIHGLNDGKFASGEKLPSIRNLAKDWSVSRFTVVQAYDRLVARGIIESRPGSGYYFSSSSTAVAEQSIETNKKIDDYSIESLLSNSDLIKDCLSASTAWLPGDWLDLDMTGRAIREFARNIDSEKLAGYSDFTSNERLLKLIQVRLAMKSIKADVSQIITMPSISQALTLIATTIIDRNSTVLIEEPGWQNLSALLKNLGVSVRGVKMTPTGPDPEHFEDQIKRFNSRFFFASAVVQNPTGLITPPATIHRILQIAEKHDVTIFEDDMYGFYHPKGVVRYAELDGFNNVIYLNSYSKSLSPQLRFAYIAAPQRFITPMQQSRALHGVCPSSITEYVIQAILQSGQFDKHMNGIRERMDKSRQRCESRLKAAGLEYWHQPTSGPFMWMRHPDYDDATAIIEKAREQNIIIAGGSIYNPRARPMPWMRFTAPWSDDDRLSDFFATLNKSKAMVVI